jgi:plasmid stabilization system protein ParE
MNLLKIRFHARNDIQEIVTYFDEINPKITDSFLKDLFDELEIIKENPLIFVVKYKETRVRYLKRFSYGIHYVFTNKTVHILAIFHTSRNPKIWENK